MKKSVFILTVVIAFFGFSANANNSNTSSTVCVNKKSGVMRFLDGKVIRKCATSERKVTIAKVGPQGPKGDRGEVGPQGAKGDSASASGSLVVEDANGANVGYLVQTTSGDQSGDFEAGTVWNPQIEKFLSVNSATGIQPLGTLGFTSTDCTGTRYLVGGNFAGGDLISVMAPGDKLSWVEVVESISGVFYFGSYTQLSEDGSETFCQEDEFNFVDGAGFSTIKVAPSPLPEYVPPFNVALSR